VDGRIDGSNDKDGIIVGCAVSEGCDDGERLGDVGKCDGTDEGAWLKLGLMVGALNSNVKRDIAHEGMSIVSAIVSLRMPLSDSDK